MLKSITGEENGIRDEEGELHDIGATSSKEARLEQRTGACQPEGRGKEKRSNIKKRP